MSELKRRPRRVRFASGGADKTVIIWTSRAEGVLRYQHSDSIQARPLTGAASCAVGSRALPGRALTRGAGGFRRRWPTTR